MIYIRRIHGSSMLPAFRAGQLVIFVKRRNYKRGDIVMFRHDGLEKIKRIEKVDGAKVFVVGDNSAGSTDSRHFGWIKSEKVVAKALRKRLKSGKIHL